MEKMKHGAFAVLIEKDENGVFIAEVPDLKGCYTQGNSVEEVLKNIREVVEMCLEEEAVVPNQFVGLQTIEV